MSKNVGPPPYAFIFLLFAIPSACEGLQVNYVPLKEGVYFPNRRLEEIAVVTGSAEGPYEELGVILIRKFPGSLEEEIHEAFRQEAMSRGADAVIHVEMEKQPVFSLSPFIFSLPFPGIVARGTAIRYKKE